MASSDICPLKYPPKISHGIFTVFLVKLRLYSHDVLTSFPHNVFFCRCGLNTFFLASFLLAIVDCKRSDSASLKLHPSTEVSSSHDKCGPEP